MLVLLQKSRTVTPKKRNRWRECGTRYGMRRTCMAQAQPRSLEMIKVFCKEFGLVVSEKKRDAVCLCSVRRSPETALGINAAGRTVKGDDRGSPLCRDGALGADPDVSVEVKLRINAAE